MSVAMYRLILLALCLRATLAAPQNSNITYMKPYPTSLETLDLKSVSKEYRIDNITLTIPNKETQVETNHHEEPKSEQSVPANNYPEKIYSNTNETTNYGSSEKDNLTNEELRNSEYIASESKQPERIVLSDSSLSESDTNESTDVLLPSENIQSSRQAKSDDIERDEEEEFTTETEEFTTEKGLTDNKESSKAPLPRLLPKLSYYGKSSYSPFSDNLIVGKRKFRSKCRCEKIWHCSKLQISVPRCPEEYFMCCS